jgi:hypothetical protein
MTALEVRIVQGLMPPYLQQRVQLNEQLPFLLRKLKSLEVDTPCPLVVLLKADKRVECLMKLNHSSNEFCHCVPMSRDSTQHEHGFNLIPFALGL